MRQKKGLLYTVIAFIMVLALLVPVLVSPAFAKNPEAPGLTKANPGSKGIQDPIMTDKGLIAGTILGDVGNIVRVYRGIPYAAPPVGALRWMPPQPVTPWEGILGCSEFKAWPPQTWPPQGSSYPGAYASEDCLYLNLYTPAQKENDRLPVMVWFHGGGLTMETANKQTYNTLFLPNHNAVIVLVNQRLGAIGYMAHPELTAEQGASGNYGTMDEIAALQWVHNNIAAFGGDPNCVTIFGESGGGVKVTALLAAPAAKGLFQRAIIQSGHMALDPNNHLPTLAEAEGKGSALMAACGVGNITAMRALPWETIIAKSNTSLFGTNLNVDGKTLPDQMSVLFETGQMNDVPLILLACEWENTSFAGMTSIAEARETYGDFDTYLTVFGDMPGTWDNMYPTHGCDLAYLFGDIGRLSLNYPWFGMLYTIAHQPIPDLAWIPPSGPNPGVNESDEFVADAFASIWIQFAATGDPSVRGLVNWPAYDPENPQYLQIDDPLTVADWDCSAFAPQCYPPVP